MEVIEHGDKFIRERIAVCPICHCKFKYFKTEIKVNHADDLMYIPCPECGTWHHLAKRLPDGVWQWI